LDIRRSPFAARQLPVANCQLPSRSPIAKPFSKNHGGGPPAAIESSHTPDRPPAGAIRHRAAARHENTTYKELHCDKS
jgi:hypothetical protein